MKKDIKYHQTKLLGKTFEFLTVRSFVGKQGISYRWLCDCKCGNTKIVTTNHLTMGNVRSCGCMLKLNGRKHGYCPAGKITPEYQAHTNMKQRCYNPSYRSFDLYGGRGIKVCDRWLGKDGFINFIADMGLKPSKTHSLDRIDPSRGYSPENCRWGTRKQQNNTKSSSPKTTNLKEHRHQKKLFIAGFNLFMNGKNGNPTFRKYLGMELSDFRIHLESLFKDGMTWDNFGWFNGTWSLDHIIPCCQFDLATDEGRAKCFHYTNLQPMWWKEQITKPKGIFTNVSI